MMPRRWSRRHIHLIRATVGFIVFYFLTPAVLGAPKQIASGTSDGQAYVAEVLAQVPGLMWSFDFLPDGKIVMTERSGKMTLYDPKAGTATPITGVPQVYESNQGGLLEVRVHPLFEKTKWIYLAYSERSGNGGLAALGRARLEGAKLAGFERLFRSEQPSPGKIQFGGRLEFDGNGALFMTVGDHDERHYAQDLSNHAGKILRLDENGKAFAGNPFAKDPNAKPEIYSLGHRNQEGLAYDAKTGELWESEFGPRGGDELNLIKPGLNYGWPVVTYGKEYWGPSIGEGAEKKGMESPVEHWVPSINPTGLVIYRGSAFPKWNGHALLACLTGQLRNLTLQNDKVTSQEQVLKDGQTRYRTVRVGPDGNVYLSADDGRFIRIRPQTPSH